ncbi:YbjN domain-containing protein [Pigmentiphaga sp.]|uniref:YbjN domain-containing protein n=1 Tax=Pigmentiphaga sp. TaxID=1977564 RepID=UPI00128B8DAE|nr:YbjN domain-containing protein [Pigmentiphaga sp.]MPS30285.1 YbjN domain-containing protein [Alcaligenaceae bacterium SAGV5]MPS55279.1 YbjN domain-containing protein [Alcaligenaceae bacterium SAGV3]MPT56638.1 YbjN domain-containing protein [Alcaligenaceae bacterium]
MSKNDNQAAVETIAAQMLTFVGADQVAEAIKAAGCAVTPIEQDGVVRLHSASHGVGFQVLWGNAQAKDEYADFTFSCPLRIQGGELPAGLLTEWHRTKRFARVSQHGDFVVLEMDVVAAGGVSPSHLVVAAQIWTQMMGQFFLYLRNFRAAEGARAVEGEQVEQAGSEPAAVTA